MRAAPRLAHKIAGTLTSRHYRVRGDSMKPGFAEGQRLLVSYAAYKATAPLRGDIVVIRGPGDAAKRYLKRLVGLPGETVSFVDGTLLIDGDPLSEPYLGGLPAVLGLSRREWTLGAREYFALGDNRSHSTDSRDFGPVPTDNIIGKVWFRYWPLRQLGVVPGQPPPSQPSPGDGGRGKSRNPDPSP